MPHENQSTNTKKINEQSGNNIELPVLQRTAISHKKFNQQDFRNLNFTEANFKDSKFTQCNFSYSVFERAYFNGAKFEQCNFTGSKFLDSNMNRSQFHLCDFKFVRFERTLLDVSEILPNLPKAPNLRREILQSLQANAVEVGDYKAQREFALEEIKATQDHNWRAIVGGDDYYEKKYSEINKKINPALSWIWLSVQELIWGNGERPTRMISSLVLILTTLAILNAYFIIGKIGWESASFGLRSFGYVITEFLGIESDDMYRGFNLMDYILAILRYVYIGLFVAVVYRASVHR